ncbi:MAG: hypothetical protein ACI4P6_03145 [Candidatus Spyradosoma sp.]
MNLRAISARRLVLLAELSAKGTGGRRRVPARRVQPLAFPRERQESGGWRFRRVAGTLARTKKIV